MILRLLRVVELKLRGSPSTFLEQPRAGLTMFIITVETNHAPKRIMISQFGDQPNLLLNVKTRLLLAASPSPRVVQGRKNLFEVERIAFIQ